MGAPGTKVYEFDDFRVDAAKRVLLRRGEPVPLSPRVFDTLLYFVEHHGWVLEKDELMRGIWPDAFVEENNLNQNVSALRRALGESRGENRYIVTLPGHGYRFVAAVTAGDEGAGSPPAVAAATTIAVLPFANMSADPENEYFCDGLAEELLNALAKVEGLKVVARTSAFSFKGRDASVGDIASALGVGAIVEGSVRRSGDRLRITVQLIDAADGFHLWSERYDREMKDIFDVQDEITLAVMDALKVKLLGEEQAAVLKRHTESTEAFHLYLKGRYFWFKTAPEEFGRCRDYFERAIEADPTYALGHAGLVYFYGFASSWGMMDPAQGWPKAEAALAEALRLDGTLTEVRNARGALLWSYRRDWAGAEQEFERAIGMSPTFAAAHSLRALYLASRGRFDEAAAESARSLALDPLSLRMILNRAFVLYQARRYDDAVEQYGQALELDPAAPSVHEDLGNVYERMGRRDEAVAEWQAAATLSGNAEAAAALGRVFAERGFGAAACAMARKRLEVLDARRARGEYVPAVAHAQAYVRLGDEEQAFEWLERAADERNAYALFLATDPIYDDLHADPRFAAVLERAGAEIPRPPE
jgi:TolB-like protein/Tfp pilus assembly protein PilF